MPLQEPPDAPKSPASALWELFTSLSVLESITYQLAERLADYQGEWKRSPAGREFRYVAPPTERTGEELRNMIEEERQFLTQSDTKVFKVLDPSRHHDIGEELEIKSPDRFWRSKLDTYHHLYAQFDGRVQSVKVTVKALSGLLDQPRASVLDLYSTRIVYDLQNLRGSVPPPMEIGPFLPGDERVPVRLRENLIPIMEWTNRIKAVVLPSLPAMLSRDPEVEHERELEPELVVGTDPEPDAEPRAGGHEADATLGDVHPAPSCTARASTPASSRVSHALAASDQDEQGYVTVFDTFGARMVTKWGTAPWAIAMTLVTKQGHCMGVSELAKCVDAVLVTAMQETEEHDEREAMPMLGSSGTTRRPPHRRRRYTQVTDASALIDRFQSLLRKDQPPEAGDLRRRWFRWDREALTVTIQCRIGASEELGGDREEVREPRSLESPA